MLLIATACLTLATQSLQVEGLSDRATTRSPTQDELEGAWSENAGQWRDGVDFAFTHGPLRAWVGAGSLWLERRELEGEQLRSHAVRFTVEGGTLKDGRGISRAPGVRSYFSGEDRADWQLGVRSWRALEFPEVRAGVDLVLRPEGASFAYDLHLAAGVNESDVSLRVDGAQELSLDEDGGLVIETSLGPLKQRPPVVWELTRGGRQVPVEASFRLLDGERFGFLVHRRDRSRALVIDPGFEWGTYLGDTDIDRVNDVEVLGAGLVLVCGLTYSPEFPAWAGSHSTSLSGLSDAFVSVFSPNGQHLIYSSFIGGTSDDEATAISVALPSQVLVAGSTSSADFPMLPTGLQPQHAGGSDGFVLALGVDLQSIQHGTFLGSGGEERIRDLSLSGVGVEVCGSTTSAAFTTTTGAWQTSFGGGNGVTGDAFLTRLNPSLDQRLYSTFIGGTHNDVATSLVSNSLGYVWVGGSTSSNNFPVTSGAFDTILNGGRDGFIALVNWTGSQADYCTFIGGGGDDLVSAVSEGPLNHVLIGGVTESNNFPVTAGAEDTSYDGFGDAFVAQLSTDGGSLDWSTYLGGDEIDQVHALAYSDALGAVAVGGTGSANFPTTTYAYDRSFNSPPGQGFIDSFLVSYDSSGAMDYSSFIGGVHDDEAFDVALNGDACVVGGWTKSLNHPVSGGAFDPSYDYSGIPDGFCLRMTLDRYPVLYGTGKLSSVGVVPELYPGGFPSAARGPYEIWLESYFPGEVGYIFHGPTARDLPFAGGSLLVGAPLHRGEPITLDFVGGGCGSWEITPSMIGQTWYFQAWFTDPGDPLGVGLTGGLELTWYP